MSYFLFLALFVGIPIGFLLIAHAWDKQNGRFLPSHFSNYAPFWVIAGHMLVALLYTTPWDNYLVATRVWYYDPALVTGIVIGWVPIEEYTFFLVQPILTGLWLLFWMKRPFFSPKNSNAEAQRRRGEQFRFLSLVILGVVWVGSTVLFFFNWQPATYLTLELIWALPPILFQLWFGGHIIYRYRRLISFTLATSTLYLSTADAIAIQAGTWTINPAQSLNIFLGGVLPVEEFLFFLLTNTLLCFGMVLVMAKVSQERLDELKSKWLPTAKPDRFSSQA